MKKNRAFAVLVAGAFALYGLVAFAFQTPTCEEHQARFCRGSHCDLDISVTSCSADGIRLPEDDLHLCKRDGPKTINWTLPAGGPFKFRDDGIDFKNLPDTQDFDPATKQKGPFKYSWDDKLQNGGRKFDYTIRIESSSGQPCDKDPRISND